MDRPLFKSFIEDRRLYTGVELPKDRNRFVQHLFNAGPFGGRNRRNRCKIENGKEKLHAVAHCLK